MKQIHISQTRIMLDRGDPYTIQFVKKSGELVTVDNAVSLKYDFYRGTRTIKLLHNNRIMTIHDIMITKINDIETFL